MGFSPRVLRNAMLSLMCLLAPELTRPVAAQDLTARQGLGYVVDPVARSPRLLGMGQLQLVEDRHNALALWDFAGNPTGIAEAESVSTFEYRPRLRSGSVFGDVPAGAPLYERQELGDHQSDHVIETWRRQRGSPAYGLVANISKLNQDRPFDATSELRDSYKVPAIGGIVNGRMPWIHSTRFDYALRGQYGSSVAEHGYYEIFHVAQGDYLGKKTATVPPPDLFTPDHDEVTNLRYGIAFAMRVTKEIKAAIGYDRQLAKWRSTQEGLRSTSRVNEDRPFDTGQATLVGRLGRHLAWAADGRAWHVASEQFFFWTVSAGPTQTSLVGDGKRLDRDLKGTSLRTQARWMSGAFELGAGFGTTFSREIITPWYPTLAGEQPGFNDFLYQISTRAGADTLRLPQQVSASQVEERSVDLLLGGSWHPPGGRGLMGVEFQRHNTKLNQAGFATGPKPQGWDIRGGGEYRVGPSFLVRGGLNYGIHDQDDLTADNAYRSTIATVGIGIQPPGSRWSADLALANEWLRPDFVDGANTRGSERQMSLQVRWPF